jgi:dynein intermediate chain 1
MHVKIVSIQNENIGFIFYLTCLDDFLKQSKGLILLYSLKNPSYPELIYNTECGVMSIDIHTDYPHLICAGFYDGSVAVFNTAESSSEPKYTSNSKNGKHTDPVWQVKWQKDDLDGNMNFFSVSSDGRVVCWIISKVFTLKSKIGDSLRFNIF